MPLAVLNEPPVVQYAGNVLSNRFYLLAFNYLYL